MQLIWCKVKPKGLDSWHHALVGLWCIAVNCKFSRLFSKRLANNRKPWYKNGSTSEQYIGVYSIFSAKWTVESSEAYVHLFSNGLNTRIARIILLLLYCLLFPPYFSLSFVCIVMLSLLESWFLQGNHPERNYKVWIE